MYFFNNRDWSQAKSYLNGYLEILHEQNDSARARRVQHLLGICDSYLGDWDESISHFLAVLRVPVADVSEIDDGDCAAAYWLGDIYSLLNKRGEALLAYCLAAHSSFFDRPSEPYLHRCILAEQEAVLLGVSKTDLKARWAQQQTTEDAAMPRSILDRNIIAADTARMLLEEPSPGARKASVATKSDRDFTFQLDQNKARSSFLLSLSKLAPADHYRRLKLTSEHFDPDTPWPLKYDPLFAMANVQRGRLLAHECDLIELSSSNLAAKLPRSSSMIYSRTDSFTSTDLTWLITTIRSGLSMLGMDWSEVANVEGTWFVVRHSFFQEKIATTSYFSIALFRHSIRSGYVAVFCPNGICGARLIQLNHNYQRGVHYADSKRIKTLLREYLDEAAKQQSKAAEIYTWPRDMRS